VPGVTRVENNLKLQGEVRTAGEVIDDGMITTTVKANLAADPVTSALAIKVETRDGRVQLGGWVDSAAAKTQAARVAAAVQGVTAVQNNLDIKKSQNRYPARFTRAGLSRRSPGGARPAHRNLLGRPRRRVAAQHDHSPMRPERCAASP
jgi:hypothetical protein